jgi:hypothetical protein
LDLTTLWGKLQEYEQELISLGKHENKEKKEKSKDLEKKSIALKASSSKSSTSISCPSESSDDDESPDEDMDLFVRKYNIFLRKNEIQHLDKNLINYRRHSQPSKQDESKKPKSRGSCYHCGKPDHYKSDCPYLKKDKAKANNQKKPTKARRAYIVWESDSDPSSKGFSSDEEETVNLCLMAHHHKKKNVNHAKYDHVDEMSYLELLNSFNTLHQEAKEAFKCLASNKKIFSYLEQKVSDSKKELEALKASMIENIEGKCEK